MDVSKALRRQQELEGLRANFDSHWQEVQDYTLPQSVGFVEHGAAGTKKMERVFDSTPITANENFAASMQAMLTPATERWHKIVPVDEALENDYEVNAWCDAATDALFRARYLPGTQWSQAIAESFLAFGAFGSAVVFVDEVIGQHLIYKTGHPREYYYIENEYGAIDTMHRKFRLSAENIVRRFGKEACPESVLKDADKSPDTPHELLHIVTPRELAGEAYAGLHPMLAFASCYIHVAAKHDLQRRAGYRTFPYAVGRYKTTAGETYGRGPGMTALPDIKTLNEMAKTVLRAGQKAVDPPVILNDDGALNAFSLRPGALNRGAVNKDGKALAQPFITGARLDISLEMIVDKRRQIEAVFKNDLFRILVEKPGQITATEALIRAQEKGALLAPPGERLQGEFIGAIVQRELDILQRAGQFPRMPEALAYRGGIRVSHSAPYNQAQKSGKGVAIHNLLAGIGAITAIDPDVVDVLDTDEIVRELRDVAGAPQKIIRSDEAVAARREQKRQQADTANVLAAAEQSGKAAKDWSQAQANAAAQPAQILPLLQ